MPRHVVNPLATRGVLPGPEEAAIMCLASFRAAQAEISAWPGYVPTPLREMPGLARAAGVARVLYKDEAARFELESFKALGGAYAVLRLIQMRLAAQGRPGMGAPALLSGLHRDLLEGATFAAATDGNHGRSVAWGCKLFGAACVIYLHAGVSQERENEIARFGAQIRRVPGGYDASVRACAADAGEQGWTVVADTSTGIDPLAPSLVMQGYGVLALEVDAALDGQPPTHMLVPAGVGGLAAAVSAHAWEAYGPRRPRIVVVEPIQADCVFRSIAAGQPTSVPGEADSFMACLSAGEISPAAWPFLRATADDVVALEEDAAADAMRRLAAGSDGDPVVAAGESGAATTAALLVADRTALGMDRCSVVVLIGSEGATDRATYRRVVGETAEMVMARAA